MSVPVILGTLLQATSALPITLFLKEGPLRPQFFELIGSLVLAPLAAVLFSWAIRSAGSHAGSEMLVTSGAYAWLRHPITWHSLQCCSPLVCSPRPAFN